MTARRAGVSALAFSLAGVTLMLLLVSVAARTGPSGIIRGHAVDPSFHLAAPSPTATATSTPQGPDRTDRLPRGEPAHDWLPLVGWVIKIAAGCYLLVLLVRGLRWMWRNRHRRQRDPAPVTVDFDVLDDPEIVIEQIRQDAFSQFELLLAGSPRNAIVACWDRFEEQAERVGVARRPWETSSEFVLRVLEIVTADPDAVRRLAGLYREARFSSHPGEESSRQAALDALRRIHDSLGIAQGAPR